MKIFATLTPCRPQTHRAKSSDQNSPHDFAELFISFSLSFSHVVHFPSLTREMFTRHSRHSFEPEDAPPAKGCNFDEDPRWTEGACTACTKSEHAEDSFPPMCPARYTILPARRGRAAGRNRGTKREPPPHRPVQSTVNACSVPPLTTSLASCRSRARPSTASNEHC